MEGEDQSELKRFPTGIAGLDTILHGGFFEAGLYLVAGAPGTGKTVLGNQIAFNHAKAGGRVVFVTLLAEAHARMLSHLRTLSFFDDSKVGDAIYYLNGHQALESEGLDGLGSLLRRTVRERKATLLVIDGFSTAESESESGTALKQFLLGLQAAVGGAGCTTLILTEYRDEPSPTYAIMDGLLELHDCFVGQGSVRELFVRKLRGSAHLRGRHIFEITSDGYVVYPRLETRFVAREAPAPDPAVRVPLGVPALDEMLMGGLRPATMTIVLGSPGSGKTTLGLTFLATGAERNERSLHFGLYESRERLIAQAAGVGIDLKSAIDRKLVAVHREMPLEMSLDAVAERLISAVQQFGARRLFIDGLGGFREGALRPERVGRFFTAIAEELRSLGVTTLLAAETHDLLGESIQIPVTGISAAVETALLLRLVEVQSRLRRVVSVLKERESDFDSTIREFRITRDGIHILGPLPGHEALLSGVAHQNAPSQPKGGAGDDEDSHR